MTALPFSDFLELLRGKGFGIGLHEHLALGKLLNRWDSTDRVQLRNAIAALIARHDEEVRQIRRLFDESYPVERMADEGGEPGGPAPRVRRFRVVRAVRSGRVWLAALLSISLVTAGFVAVRVRLDLSLPIVPHPSSVRPLAPVAIPNTTGGLSPSVVESPPEPAMSAPVPRPRTNWKSLAWLGGPTLIVALFGFWGAQLRTSARRWTMDAWESVLAGLPGPFHARLVMKDLVTRLPRADVEEAATILGRSFSRDRPGPLLDVRETLRRTLKSGMQPHLVFRPRRVPKSILVLQDVSQSMASHSRRVDSLCQDLQRQGIALERWFFDGDVSLPARLRFGLPVPLETLLRTREEGPVMILSAGFGVPASLGRSNRDWLRALEKQTRRVWVNPILDSKLWPAALMRLPLLVVPMTRGGLLQAAKRLAHDDRVSGNALGHALSAPRPVTSSHVEQLRQIASLVPYPTPDLLELLRQQFAPDIPETAVLYAVDRRSAATGLPFRMGDVELREQLRSIRLEAPELEIRVRKYLLRVLADSEPPPGSAAHLRWEASVAIHHVQLAELEGRDGKAAVDALQQLYRGPLWEEVRDLVGRQASAGPVTTQLRSAVRVRRHPDPPAFIDRTGGPAGSRLRWTMPGWREVAAACAVAVVVSGAAAFTNPFQQHPSNIPDAYTLEYLASTGGTDPARLEIRRRSESATLPLTVRLYRDQGPIGAAIVLVGSNPVSVPLIDSTISAYQVRATLANGALALSNPIWAPSIIVIIDVQPWARVTIASADTKIPAFVEATPVAVRLPEGRYSLSFENGGLNGPFTQTIDVSGSGQRTFRYDMPGFKVDDVLKNLASRKTSKY